VEWDKLAVEHFGGDLECADSQVSCPARPHSLALLDDVKLRHLRALFNANSARPSPPLAYPSMRVMSWLRPRGFTLASLTTRRFCMQLSITLKCCIPRQSAVVCEVHAYEVFVFDFISLTRLTHLAVCTHIWLWVRSSPRCMALRVWLELHQPM